MDNEKMKKLVKYYDRLEDNVHELTDRIMRSDKLYSDYTMDLIVRQSRILTIMEQLEITYGNMKKRFNQVYK